MSCNCNNKDIPSIRIGNDIDIRWAIYNGVESNGDDVIMEPYKVEGKDISVYLKSKYDTQKASYVNLVDNIVYCRFYGKEQKFFGPYSIVLIENEGKDGMHTLDECKAFELVGCECDVDRHGGNGYISISTVELETIAQIGIAGEKIEIDEELNGSSANPVQNKAITEALKTKVDKEEGKGLSEEDFTSQLKKKLEELTNYNDEEVQAAITGLRSYLDYLVAGGYDDKIDSFNDFLVFFDDVKSGTKLKDILDSINYDIDDKTGTIIIHTDLDFNTLTDKLETTGNLENHGVTYEQIKKQVERCGTIVLQQSDGKVCYCTRAEMPLGGLLIYLHFIKDFGTVQYDIQLAIGKTNNIAYVISKENFTPDKSLSLESTHSVQNKVITEALNGKVDIVEGKGLSTEDFTTEYKNKLDSLGVGDDGNLTDAVVQLQIDVVNAEKYDSKIADKSIKVVQDYGDIKAGTTLSKIDGKTYAELFDAILFPTINPKITYPKATLSLKNYSGLQKVGAQAPTESNFNTVFDRGEITINGERYGYTAGANVPANSYFYVNGIESNRTFPQTVGFGSTTYTWVAAYGAGDVPVNNKGVAVGDAIKAGTVKSSAVSVVGTYPWYATTSGATNGQPIEQELLYWIGIAVTTPEFTLLPTDTCKQVILTPGAIKEIYIKDTTSGNFIQSDLAGFVETTETRNGRTYYRYEYTGKARGEITLKIKF